VRMRDTTTVSLKYSIEITLIIHVGSVVILFDDGFSMLYIGKDRLLRIRGLPLGLGPSGETLIPWN